jgi:hypothetical protein
MRSYVFCITIYLSIAIKKRRCVSLLSSLSVSGLWVDFDVFPLLVLTQMASRGVLLSDKSRWGAITNVYVSRTCLTWGTTHTAEATAVAGQVSRFVVLLAQWKSFIVIWCAAWSVPLELRPSGDWFVFNNMSMIWPHLRSSAHCFVCFDVVTDGQSAYPSWCQAPLWDPWTDFSFSSILPDNFFAFRLGAPSLTRGRVCNL